MPIKLETARLWMREIEPGDASGLFELDSNPEVHRYLGNQPVQSMEEIDRVINLIRQQYAEHGIARWAVIEKESNQFIGWAGLKWITEPIRGRTHYYDLGYRLIPTHWGKGYATEASQALLQYAFDVLNVETVSAMTDIDNLGSNRVLQKIGMTCTGQFLLDGIPHNWYDVQQTDF
jgi:RimJ/RimL family protein N-acetyltransferase